MARYPGSAQVDSRGTLDEDPRAEARRGDQGTDSHHLAGDAARDLHTRLWEGSEVSRPALGGLQRPPRLPLEVDSGEEASTPSYLPLPREPLPPAAVADGRGGKGRSARPQAEEDRGRHADGCDVGRSDLRTRVRGGEDPTLYTPSCHPSLGPARVLNRLWRDT